MTPAPFSPGAADRDERAGSLHAVVLAGGSGTRFWPLSRELSPKQMLSIFGGVSLITRAIRRVQPFLGGAPVRVVTNERLFDELRNHLTAQAELSRVPIEYLAEPLARNTGPALALAAAAIVRDDPDGVLMMLPSDHLLDDGDQWRRVVRAAIALAEQGRLVTIGLEPTSPETGYGYICPGDIILEHTPEHAEGRTVAEFVEKPELKLAEHLVGHGCLWNSGMLVAKASVVLEELRAAGVASATPESANGVAIANAAEKLAALPREQWLTDEARELYALLPSVPFDKAVLEVSDVVACVPSALEWSDVGSLLAIERLAPKDERGNVLVGRVQDVDSSGVIAFSQDRLVATLGLTDVLVVDTADATLVAAKDRAQDVRAVVDALKASGAREVVETRSSLRPWGMWTLLVKGEGFLVKSIDVAPGQRLSLQSHEHRSEHWVVVEGVATVQRAEETFEVRANESVYLPQGVLHRLDNRGEVPLKIIEVAVGDYLGEDDIVRYEDDFGR